MSHPHHTSNTATLRTSPRLDAPAAFFSGIPPHAVSHMASWYSGGEVKSAEGISKTNSNIHSSINKRFLLTTSLQGELVHWIYLDGVGYQARSMLIPPTSTSASAYHH